ncbi:MAG: hypothetical protein HC819_15235 [Cyclobacteriaceae bacterium]|nr:hypothetical protein [Cyclobacteriaceae bacterium]
MPVAAQKFGLFANFWILIPAILGMVACQTEDCTSISNNFLRVGFFKTDTMESGRVVITPIDTVFYSIMAEGNDSVFYDAQDVASIFDLPVNPAADMTSFRLEVLDSIRYDSLSKEYFYYKNPSVLTMSVQYQRSARIIVEDCGTEISYSKLTLVDSAFQKTAVVGSKLSRLNELTKNLNIEVYF